jgi:hypothetical protein
MSNIIDYKTKYLKYKMKYLQLKGGGKCPKIGHRQHLGECWHDAFLMIILYGDGISEHIQHIFDNVYVEEIEGMLVYMIRNLDIPENYFLTPLHINMKNEKDYDNFNICAGNYIKFLHERYKNEKRDLIPIEGVDPKQLYRQQSIVPAIRCPEFIFEMANYRSTKPTIFELQNHGGDILEYYMITTFLNYYLLNFKINEALTGQLTKFIKLDVVDIYSAFGECNITAILNMCDKIINLVDNSQGVIINSRMFKDSIPNFENTRAHAQAFLVCDGKEYFYDDNGVELIMKQRGSGPETDERRKIEEKQKIEDFLTEHGNRYAGKDYITNTMCLFDWKKFMKETCRDIRTKLEDRRSYMTNLSPEEAKQLLFKFSDFYDGYDKTRDITIKAHGFVMHDDKDKDIKYIDGFHFITCKNFKDGDIKAKKTEYFSEIEGMLNFNLNMRKPNYNIDDAKIKDLISEDDTVELKWVLKYAGLDLEKLEEYKKLAETSKKNKSKFIIKGLILKLKGK